MSSSDHTSNPTTSFNTPIQTPYYQQAPQQQTGGTPQQHHFQQTDIYGSNDHFIQSSYLQQGQVIFCCYYK